MTARRRRQWWVLVVWSGAALAWGSIAATWGPSWIWYVVAFSVLQVLLAAGALIADAVRERREPDPPPLTWSCQICKRERPDELIDTAQVSGEVFPGAEILFSVRHCRDRSTCREGAEVLARQWLQRVTG